MQIQLEIPFKPFTFTKDDGCQTCVWGIRFDGRGCGRLKGSSACLNFNEGENSRLGQGRHSFSHYNFWERA